MNQENVVNPQFLGRGESKSSAKPVFQVAVREIQSQHAFQFYLDYGSQPGTWFELGINQTAYAVGYLPEDRLPG